jgi:hypothetical protein
LNKLIIYAIIAVAVIAAGLGVTYVVFLQPKTYTVTLSVLGNGQVSFQPQGGYQTAIQVQQGQAVTIKAVPDSGYKFSNWAGDLSGKDNPATITVQKDMNIVAVFLPST